MKARIIEIFSSVQGEGLWVGRPQVFVRFHGCSLKCTYCDTPLTHYKIHEARIEWPPYSKNFEKRNLEFSPEELTQNIARFGIASLALTGGEPLEQVDFLETWLPTLKLNYEILLETSGKEGGALSRVIDCVDMVSMDIKLPSSSGEKPLWEEHERFIQTARLKNYYGKVVFDENMSDDEMKKLCGYLDRHTDLALVFQPVSPLQKRDLKKCLTLFQGFAEKYLSRVRFIPQMHKFLSVL